MTDRKTVAAARKIAQAAGYVVYEGAYRNGTDNRLGRWYFDKADNFRRPYGAGHATKSEAWVAASDQVAFGIESDRIDALAAAQWREAGVEA